ncbi:molybdopterin-binding protein, partial [Glutamicibacter creatinolyticus]|uniref:molybdopterin-binding protein n=1 Tax=Glutamicibacter creatinolyticus TaxID=162496 RepID=UPI003B985B77
TAAVLVTGAELQAVGAVLQRGQIPESNSWLMQGLLTEAGITQITVQRCTDDTDLVREQLARLGASHDVVISTGGVGPGTHD